MCTDNGYKINREGKMKNELVDKWNKRAKSLIGRKIIKVRYMTDKEQEGMYWDCKPVCIQLDDGEWLYPSADDEGNQAGALFSTNEKYEFPVI